MNNRLLHALANKSFLFLWIAEIFSQVAMNMMNFILILVAFSLTNSNTAVSGIVLSFTIPAIIFGVLAGVYVDRWDKKKVLFITNITRTVFLILLAIFNKSLVAVYVLSFLISIVTQFFIPAETPIIPLIVGKDMLLSANALFGLALYGSILLAYGLSGPFLILLGSKNAFIALAVLYLIASLCILLVGKTKLVVREKRTKDHIQNLFAEIKHAFSFIVGIRDISKAFFLLILSQVLILIIAVIGPGFAKQILGISINEFPLYFVTPAAIGMGIGAFILTNYYHHISKQKTATVGLFITSIVIFLLPYGSKVTSRTFIQDINAYLPHFMTISILHIMIILAFVMGIAIALIFVPSNTIIQEQTSDEVRGKIYGTLNTLVSLSSILPVVVIGSLADVFGVKAVLTSLSIGIFLIAVIRSLTD